MGGAHSYPLPTTYQPLQLPTAHHLPATAATHRPPPTSHCSYPPPTTYQPLQLPTAYQPLQLPTRPPPTSHSYRPPPTSHCSCRTGLSESLLFIKPRAGPRVNLRGRMGLACSRGRGDSTPSPGTVGGGRLAYGPGVLSGGERVAAAELKRLP